MTISDASSSVAEALSLHRAGRLDEAASSYRAILQSDPRNADALVYLAMIACHRGNFEDGIGLLERALQIKPANARAYNMLGMALGRLNRNDEAARAYDAALMHDPALADAYGNRAEILVKLGRTDDALASFDRAVALRPDSVEDWCNRGSLLQELRRPREAIESFDRALAVDGSIAAAHYNRGNALKDLGRFDEALAAFDRAIGLTPAAAQARELAPLHLNRGRALFELDRYPEAMVAFDKALSLDPRLAAAAQGRGQIFVEQNRPDLAHPAFEQAAALDPANDEIALSLGLLQLKRGEWKEGLKNYERRAAARTATLPRDLQWCGEALGNRTLVLVEEQGAGDIIQFSRYAGMLHRRGIKTAALVRPAMKAIMAKVAGIEAVFTDHNDVMRLGDDMRWVALASVPFVTGMAFDAVQTAVPYIAVDQDRMASWRSRLTPGKFSIGIAWRGAPSTRRHMRMRSIPLAAFAPLAALPDVELISLQVGPGSEDVGHVPFGSRIRTFGETFDRDGAFLDTAAVMMSLDLTVSCDTSICHLAGALGRPVFTALPQVSEWRWLIDRTDTPWYPTMRLFRQTRPGEWADVFDAIAGAVADLQTRSRPVP